MHRRTFLKSALTSASILAFCPRFVLAAGTSGAFARLAALEQRRGGRLGVAILDTDTGIRVAHRGAERFLLCSTFKLLAVAAVLARVDRGAERLDRRIVFDNNAVLAWAPVTHHHVGSPGMSVAELCAAAITVSDNTAANLLLASMGGPDAVTHFVRSFGDTVTRLDRTEPDLNVGAPGDIRDTTTPDAMLDSMQHVLLGNVLSEASRAHLIAWLRACTTGSDKLRAGIPAGWTSGDKTGSGSHGETNDVAIIWLPRRKPILVTTYYAGSSDDVAARGAVLAEVGRIAVAIQSSRFAGRLMRRACARTV